jgi:hypothetical protein
MACRRSITRAVLVVVLLLAGLVALATAADVAAVSTDVVISQVYGGGGNTDATYKNDYVELLNRETSTVGLSGWSIQYASSVGAVRPVTNLSGSIPAGGHFLVQEAPGLDGTTASTRPSQHRLGARSRSSCSWSMPAG